jgi:hypothetical protein
MNEYRTQIASDVLRDGLGCELIDDSGKVIAEVFRSDATQKVTLSTFSNDVDISDVLKLLRIAEQRLGPLELEK